MDNLHLIHMLFMAKPLNGMNWVENLAQFITQPFVSLIFTYYIYWLFIPTIFKTHKLNGNNCITCFTTFILAFLINGDVSITVYNWPHTTHH